MNFGLQTGTFASQPSQPQKVKRVRTTHYKRFKLPEMDAEFEKHMAILGADPRMEEFEDLKYPQPDDPGILWVHLFWAVVTPQT